MKQKMSAVAIVLSLISCTGKPASIKDGAFDHERAQRLRNGRSIRESGDIIIAVLPLSNNSPDRALDKTGVALADLITNQFASVKGLRVVERERIDQIFNELKLGLSGAMDQGTAVRIGAMVGANVMAFGGFSTMGRKVLVTIRLVKVETSEIVGGATERGEDFSSLDVLAEKAARKLADAIKRH